MKDDVNDFITKGKNSASKIKENLFRLKKHNIRVMIKTPVMKYNSSEYYDIHSFANKNGFKYMMSPTIFAKSDGSTDNLSVRIDTNELYEAIEYYDKITIRNEPTFKKYGVPCTVLFYNIFVDSSGDVFPCNSFFLEIGSIHETSLNNIWCSSRELMKIKQVKNTDLYKCQK